MKKILLVLVLMFSCFFIIGCGDNNQGKKEEVVTDIKITGKNQCKLGETLQLGVSFTPSTATSTITWSSNNEKIATVNESGVVFGVSIGIAKITATSENGISKTKVISVKEELDPEYPDLGGYTIRIAYNDYSLGTYDPFYISEDGTEFYDGLDIEYAKAAWEWVEEQFNCNISVEAYPSDAAWGSGRVNYILTEARANRAAFDIYVLTDTFIPECVQGGALLDLTEWYNKYGNSFMDYSYITSGSYKGGLYSLTESESDVYNTLVYNVNLVRECQAIDPTIEEPAKMFNDDNWDYDTFYEFCVKCQNALNSTYGYDESGNPLYYVLGGYPAYYWQLMTESSGVIISDTTSFKINITGDVETQTADLLKKMYIEGLMDPKVAVDKQDCAWINGRGIFNTGEYWFVNDSLRYADDLWGEGEATQYGYVPYPAKPGTHKEDYKFGTFGGQTWVMATGRNYQGYGEECTAENIYYAMITYLQRKKNTYRESAEYNEDNILTIEASKYFATTESIKAFVYMNKNAKTMGFYDPMSYANNNVASMYDSEFAKSINAYIMNTGAASWAEAVAIYQDVLQETLVNLFK